MVSDDTGPLFFSKETIVQITNEQQAEVRRLYGDDCEIGSDGGGRLVLRWQGFIVASGVTTFEALLRQAEKVDWPNIARCVPQIETTRAADFDFGRLGVDRPARWEHDIRQG